MKSFNQYIKESIEESPAGYKYPPITKNIPLQEKFVNNEICKYHINPTASQINQFMDNTLHKQIRLLSYKNNLYVWDAYSMGHDDFIGYVLKVDWGDLSGIKFNNLSGDESRGFIYKYKTKHYEKNYIGIELYKEQKKIMDNFASLYETKWIKKYKTDITLIFETQL